MEREQKCALRAAGSPEVSSKERSFLKLCPLLYSESSTGVLRLPNWMPRGMNIYHFHLIDLLRNGPRLGAALYQWSAAPDSVACGAWTVLSFLKS